MQLLFMISIFSYLLYLCFLWHTNKYYVASSYKKRTVVDIGTIYHIYFDPLLLPICSILRLFLNHHISFKLLLAEKFLAYNIKNFRFRPSWCILSIWDHFDPVKGFWFFTPFVTRIAIWSRFRSTACLTSHMQRVWNFDIFPYSYIPVFLQ